MVSSRNIDLAFFRYANDGRLLGIYTRAPDNTIVKSEVYSYLSDAEANGAAFPDLYGAATSGDDGVTNLVRPIAVTTIAQGGAIAGPTYYVPPPPPPPPPPCTDDCPPPPPPPDCDPVTHICQDPAIVFNPTGVVAINGAIDLSSYVASTISAQGADVATFTKQVDVFNPFANPLQVTKFSSLGAIKIDVTTYEDDLTQWVIGQVGTFSTNGIQVSRTEYYANALPRKKFSFGKAQNTLTYNLAPGPDAGTLHTVTDERGNTTTLTDWKRGIPQLIRHPATNEAPGGATESAVVNNNGWIDSVTDENGAGYRTDYTYDLMGRLTSIVYPTGDSTAWETTTFSFGPIDTGEYGLPAGHWKQTVTTGNARKSTYFDAMWRPVVEETYDAANTSNTLSQTVKRYNTDGNLIYQSYPIRGLSAYTAPTFGIHTAYDALDRVTSVGQDSELGRLVTTTEYLPGLRTRTTNPRLKETTVSYRAYDQPTFDWPVAISHPEASYTDIDRDVFGKPNSLTRRNADSSLAVMRRYEYDVQQRLCKSIEPETAATVLEYDAASNVAWSAGGLNLPSSECDTTAVPAAVKVTRTYDARNRLSTMLFSDGDGSQSWAYTPDGLPALITTLNDKGTTSAVNAYTYNKRRLMTGESLRQSEPDYTWALGYGYNSQGNVASHTSPGLTVNYEPNALGQPTQAGTYATGVSYFPNGAMKQFTYGNGIEHNLQQNVRGLPERSRDSYGDVSVHDDNYDYDTNGNVSAISDGLPGGRGDRDMTYDGLDRLTSANSPMFGMANYGYDVLDNLKTVKVAGGSQVRDHTYVYDYQGSGRLTNVTNTVGGASVIGLGYDDQGNLANKNGQVHDFDFGNRLRDVTGKEQYRYDGYGRRVQAKHAVLGDIYSMYGADGVLRYQQDYRTQKVSSYVYLNGSLVARVTEPTAAMPAPVLNAPASGSGGTYSLSWSTVSGASRYRVEESINSGEWSQVSDTVALSWGTSNRPSGSYRYRARSCHLGCSAYSSIVTVDVDLVPSGVPILTVPTFNTNGSYLVDWSSVALATRYEVEEQVNAGSWSQIENAATTSLSISGKSAGNYGYRVRACNASGCAGWSVTATVQVISAPSTAPTVSAPSQSINGAYTVSWTAVSTAATYRLEESVGGGTWTLLHDGPAITKALTGRVAGSYSYRVTACNAAGCGPLSAAVPVQVIYAPTAAPTAIVPSQSFNGAYSVSWTAVATSTIYQLEERVNGGAWILSQDAFAISASFASKAAGSYSYRVKACNAGGCGPTSPEVSVQVLYPPSSAPTLSAPSQANSAYAVGWSSVAAATSYQLEELPNGGVWSLQQNSASTSMAFTAKSVGTYSYRVKACNAAGCGPASSTITVQVVAYPALAPTLTVPATSSTGNYTVSWTAVSGATSYKLYERPQGSQLWSPAQVVAGTSQAISKTTGSFDYKVVACNASGCGPSSVVKSIAVQLPGILPVPMAPSVHIGTYGCTVQWGDTPNATSHRLIDSNRDVSTFPITTTQILTTCAVPYRVAACNAYGCSAYSEPSSDNEMMMMRSAP